MPGVGLVEGTVEYIVSHCRAEPDRGSRSVAQSLDDFRTVGMIFHLCGYLGGVTEHAAVGGDDRNPRTELSGELAADIIETRAGAIKGNGSGEQTALPAPFAC